MGHEKAPGVKLTCVSRKRAAGAETLTRRSGSAPPSSRGEPIPRADADALTALQPSPERREKLFKSREKDKCVATRSLLQSLKSKQRNRR